MRIYKVVFTKRSDSKPLPYGKRRTIYHDRTQAEKQAEWWRTYMLWDAHVVQSTEFEWEE